MALSKERNEQLTQVGPGTAGGDLLRRYWMPISPAKEVRAAKSKKRVRILGEHLVLFRDGQGRLGLIPEHCPHRHASLYFGFLEDDGLRCSYHGWKFAADGECIEQPFEAKDTKLRGLACRPSYPVEELGGLIFAYLGPSPAPLLPRWEALVREDGVRSIVQLPVHNCNWVQAQENSHDPVHVYYLHGHMLLQQGLQDQYPTDFAYLYRPIDSYEFEVCHEPAWTGIRKIRTYGGDRPEREAGHPAVFPNILVTAQAEKLVMHFRVPMDDEHTAITWIEFTPTDRAVAATGDPQQEPTVTYLAHPLGVDGEYNLATFENQDLMAWETQGAVFDRSTELLGSSDRGITLFRNLLREQIELVARGEEPVGVIRDPAINQTVTFGISDAQAELHRKLVGASGD
jgi:5,5'-dehydrodivanillate O-demethylase